MNNKQTDNFCHLTRWKENPEQSQHSPATQQSGPVSDSTKSQGRASLQNADAVDDFKNSQSPEKAWRLNPVQVYLHLSLTINYVCKLSHHYDPPR